MGIKEWDIAAGVLILSEAGGCYCLINGEKPDDFLHRRQVLACCSEELSKFSSGDELGDGGGDSGEEMSSKLEYIDWWEDQK